MTRPRAALEQNSHSNAQEPLPGKLRRLPPAERLGEPFLLFRKAYNFPSPQLHVMFQFCFGRWGIIHDTQINPARPSAPPSVLPAGLPISLLHCALGSHSISTRRGFPKMGRGAPGFSLRRRC